MTAYSGIPMTYILILALIIILCVGVFFLARKFEDTKPKLSYILVGLFVLLGLGAVLFGTNMNSMALKNHQKQVLSYVSSMGENVSITEGLENPKNPINESNETKVVVDTKQGLTRCVGTVEQGDIKFLCQDKDNKFTVPLESLV